jgi:hypothetical protein
MKEKNTKLSTLINISTVQMVLNETKQVLDPLYYLLCTLAIILALFKLFLYIWLN